MANKLILSTIDAAMIVLALLLFVISAPVVIAEFESGNFQNIDEIAAFCVSTDIFEASTCVVDVTNEFYKYNIDNVGKDLDFQTLKEQGGVCSSWSNYYDQIGKRLGYNTEEVIVQAEEGLFHQFSVWSNKDRYCVLDQTNVFCVDLQ